MSGTWTLVYHIQSLDHISSLVSCHTQYILYVLLTLSIGYTIYTYWEAAILLSLNFMIDVEYLYEDYYILQFCVKLSLHEDFPIYKGA